MVVISLVLDLLAVCFCAYFCVSGAMLMTKPREWVASKWSLSRAGNLIQLYAGRKLIVLRIWGLVFATMGAIFLVGIVRTLLQK